MSDRAEPSALPTPRTPVTRVVFFDVAGTLLHVRGSVGAQYAALARRFGVEADPAELDRLFPIALRAAPPMAFPGAAAAAVPDLERQVWRDLVRRILADAGLARALGDSRFEDYFTALYRHFETVEAWEVYPDVVPLVQALRARDVGTGIISNFDSRLLGLLDRLGLARWFESVTISSRVGAAKPDPAIFRHALARHGVAPGEALHVGDSPIDDVAGAAAAGLAAVLVDRAGRHPGAAPGCRVTTLGDVLRFL